jgi:hypothetical protein
MRPDTNTKELARPESGWREPLRAGRSAGRMAARLGVICALALLPGAAQAQTAVDLRTQGKDVDFSGASSTRPAQTGTSLPATCNVGAAFFLSGAPAGSNWYGCTATNTWSVQGGGAASFPAMAVSAGTTVLTIGATCSTLSPCNVRVSTTVYAFTSAVSATLVTGTGTAFVYVDTSGNLTVGHNFGAGNLTCTGACVALNGITAFPPDAIPVWSWGAIGGVWNVNGGTDQRAFLSQKVVTCGTNLQCTNSGNGLTINAPVGLTSVNGTTQQISAATAAGVVTLSLPSNLLLPSGTIFPASIPSSVVSDTNVTGSLSGNVLTLGWAGTLAKSRLLSTVVYTDQSNSWSAGTQDFHLAAHTLPARNGLTAAIPSTCAVGEEYFATDATAGQNKFLCTSTNTWTQQSGGGSGGGGGITGVNGTTQQISTVTASGVVTLSLPSDLLLPSGTIFPAAVPTSVSNDTNVTGSISGNVLTFGWSGTLAKSRLLSTVVYTDQSNTWSAGTQDFHLAPHTLPAQNGLTAALPSSCTVGEEYFAVDARAGQNKYLCTAANTWTQQSGAGQLTAPLVDFADHSSTATSSTQTLTSVTLPAGAMGANNNYAILAISGLQATTGNSIALSFGSTTVLLGNNSSTLGLGSGTTFLVECTVIRTGSSAQKISCISGLGQNLAGPYVAFTTGSENLSANVVVTVSASTNGNAGDVVLKTLELRPVNF